MRAFVKLFAIIIPIFICDVSPVPSASTSPLWRGTYSQSNYWYSDYAVPKPEPKKTYVPTAQTCPETGRTVCSQVKPYYPTDDVYEVIRLAKAKRFNISSEFVDESQNDEEPKFAEPYEPPPYDNRPKHEGYVVYQTALHYDYNNNNNNYNNRQPNPNYHSSYSPHNSPPAPHYGYHNNYANQRPNEQYYPFDSQYQTTGYSGVKSPNYYSANDMITQQHQTRYKRQTPREIESACPSRTILVEPKAGLNDQSQWKYVVNLADRDPRLKQAIKVEVCQTPGQPCSNQVSLPFGFISRCRQKYIKKKLLSLDPSGQSISSENFFSPSCCVCEIVRNTNK